MVDFMPGQTCVEITDAAVNLICRSNIKLFTALPTAKAAKIVRLYSRFATKPPLIILNVLNSPLMPSSSYIPAARLLTDMVGLKVLIDSSSFSLPVEFTCGKETYIVTSCVICCVCVYGWYVRVLTLRNVHV